MFKQLLNAGIDWKEIRTVFVTHKHLDHLLGIIWLIRMAGEYMSSRQYEGTLTIYAHDELIEIIHNMAKMLLQEKETCFLGKRILLNAVKDKESKTILEKKVTFFDIHSTKARQYGFCMEFEDNKKLTCLGDEPYKEATYQYVKNSEWLLHEAFCLYSQAELFDPYTKHHSTVKEACEAAQAMNVKNLLLYHTEDRDIKNRKLMYTTEGKKFYSGNIFVPDDLEVISL